MNHYQLFENKSYNDKINVQSNLAGRTHYFNEDSMKFHKSKILYSTITDGGLLLGVIESYAVDMYNNTRAFRPVIFDVFGDIVNERLSLEEGLKTKDQAKELMREQLDSINAKKVTMKGIKDARKWHDHKLRNLRTVMRLIK